MNENRLVPSNQEELDAYSVWSQEVGEEERTLLQIEECYLDL